ncbi:MAG: hypothetical protein R6U95_03435 [Bacteroidales bacterium]
MIHTHKILIMCITCFISSALSAQVGISTETPDNATELHVVSPKNNTGVLIPKLTSVEMNNMSTASHGILIYNTDKNKFMYNAGDTTTQIIWTTVGDIPAVEDISTFTNGQIGDIRYNTESTNKGIFYWKNGSGWTKLATPGP